MKSTASNYAESVREIVQAFEEILDNVQYIQREIENCPASPEIRGAIRTACSKIDEGLFWDVRGEIDALREKLHLEEQTDPGRNPDPRVTLNMITGWTGQEIDKLNPVIELLRGSSGAEEKAVLILLVESGLNMWNAWDRMTVTAA